MAIYHAVPEELSAHLLSLPADRGQRMASITDWAFSRVIAALMDQIGVENIITGAQAAYDKFVAPLDVPGIPNEMEPALIDAPARMLIGVMIRGFYNLVHQPQPQPQLAPGRAAAPRAIPQRVWIGEAA